VTISYGLVKFETFLSFFFLRNTRVVNNYFKDFVLFLSNLKTRDENLTRKQLKNTINEMEKT